MILALGISVPMPWVSWFHTGEGLNPFIWTDSASPLDCGFRFLVPQHSFKDTVQTLKNPLLAVIHHWFRELTNGNLNPVLVVLVKWPGFYYVWISLVWGQWSSCWEEAGVKIRWWGKHLSDTGLAQRRQEQWLILLPGWILEVSSRTQTQAQANRTLSQVQQQPLPPVSRGVAHFCSGLTMLSALECTSLGYSRADLRLPFWISGCLQFFLFTHAAISGFECFVCLLFLKFYVIVFITFIYFTV